MVSWWILVVVMVFLGAAVTARLGSRRRPLTELMLQRTRKFDTKMKNRVSVETLKEYAEKLDPQWLKTRLGWIELYDQERIVFLNVPWGESYCQCDEDASYKELIETLRNKFG